MSELIAWRDEYARLCEYISANPEIVLNKNEISIPQSVRDRFYGIFDDIRMAVVAERLDAMSGMTRTLCERYARIEKEAAELLGVEEIEMPVDLRVFLHKPKDGLIRAIYNCLFGFIQGKIDEVEFERLADESITAAAAGLSRLGYERWVGLELIKLLEPGESFFVDLDNDEKPCLRELETCAFGRQVHHPTMRIPELVVRSCRFDMLVAVKMALVKEIDEYYVEFKPRVRPKRRTGDTSFTLDSRAVLLSFLENENKIPVYADIFECTRTPPDWLVEFIHMDDPTGVEETLQRVERHMEILNPKFGCTLISSADDFHAVAEMIPGNVRLIPLGFDVAKLQAGIDALAPDCRNKI